MDANACLRVPERPTGAPEDPGSAAGRRPDARPFVPVVLAALTLLAAGIGGCGKSPEEVKATAAAQQAQTAGRLVVKSNVAGATIEAARLPTPEDASTTRAKGTVDQVLSGLPPGKYVVTAHADSWAEDRKSVV